MYSFCTYLYRQPIQSCCFRAPGIVICLGLILTFVHANSVVKQQVARQGRRNLGALAAVSLNLVACISLIVLVFRDDR